MISAKEAKQKIEEVKKQEEIEQRARWRKEEAETNKLKELAKKVVPEVLKTIENEIEAAINSKEHSIYFRFDQTYFVGRIGLGGNDDKLVYVDGSHLWKHIEIALEKLGYTVKYHSHTPTTGGDPDSGEGAYACGPTQYSLTIQWE